MKWIVLLAACLAVCGGILLWTGRRDDAASPRPMPASERATDPATEPPREAQRPDRAVLAQEAFDALATPARVPGLVEPRGHWIPAPALLEDPPDLLVRHHRDLLLREARANACPEGTRFDRDSDAAEGTAALRQGLALSLLAVGPSEEECVRVRDLLAGGGVWQPWRAALVLAVTGDARWFADVRAVLDAEPFGFGAAHAALALGIIGHEDGAPRLEAFLRSTYGARGYEFGKAALLALGRRSARARAAVTKVAFSLLKVHPGGTRTDGGISWQEDHPGRVGYIQTTAIELLRKLGTREDADALRSASGALVEPSQRLLDYLEESMRLMRARGP